VFHVYHHPVLCPSRADEFLLLCILEFDYLNRVPLSLPLSVKNAKFVPKREIFESMLFLRGFSLKPIVLLPRCCPNLDSTTANLSICYFRVA
jgi:hypothetical protein